MPGELRTCLTQGVKTKETKETSFSAWSAAQGVTTNGIGCREIPGRGLGVVAGHCIKVNSARSNKVVIFNKFLNYISGRR